MELSRKSRIIQLLVILFGINFQAHLIDAQRVEVSPENIIVREGGSTSVTCRYGEKINFCLFRINGSSQISVSESYDQNGIRYTGAGLTNGECGITIDRVLSENNGQIQCTLGVSSAPQGIVEGFAEVIVAKSAEPQIQIDYDQRTRVLNTDSPLRALCIVEHARPKAKIQWFLNDQQIRSEGRNQEVETSAGEFSSKQELEYRLSPEDDGKQLICKAVQFSDDSENRATSLQLNIQYSPVPEPDFHVYGLDLGQTATINVTIRANPAPRVQWTVDGTIINEGQRSERYSANMPEALGNGFYNVTFSIGGLTLEDTTKTFYFKAFNMHGSRDYTVKISSSDKPLTAHGLEAGAIVGIVVACAVLILVILLVIFARLTGRWCFAGATLNTDIGPDSEAQIHPNQNDDLDGKEFEGEENIDTRPQSEEATPPVTDKLEAQKKNDIKNGQHQNGKEAKSNTPV